MPMPRTHFCKSLAYWTWLLSSRLTTIVLALEEPIPLMLSNLVWVSILIFIGEAKTVESPKPEAANNAKKYGFKKTVSSAMLRLICYFFSSNKNPRTWNMCESITTKKSPTCGRTSVNSRSTCKLGRKNTYLTQFLIQIKNSEPQLFSNRNSRPWISILNPVLFNSLDTKWMSILLLLERVHQGYVLPGPLVGKD